MKTYTGFVILLITIIFNSCGLVRQPVSTRISDNNKDYRVDYLFEHDGCKVYRFCDNGNYVYFTNCNGNVTAIANDSTSHRTETITRIR
ncbi:DUF4884 domain-containing protein [Dysgonomonas sp. OttesenSCG-928-M03]|nr:DUF4884 domain-containing protein [Dysgonomonas sp. OttesenSCG-928-M03]